MTPLHEWQLDTRHIGRRVLVYQSLDSTNTRCAAFAADPQNVGLVVMAHVQTAGRGQHGRRWLCEAGTGVLLSVLLFPPQELRRPVLLTAWAAVSVCELIEELTGLAPRIKWPNDVLINCRKTCGILIEQKGGIIAGIGLNLNQGEETFLADNLTEAGSLRLLTGRSFDVEETAQKLIHQLDQNYEQLHNGEYAALEMRWKERFPFIGKHVRVEGNVDTHEGDLLDLSFEGVMLDSADGPLLLQPESIRHIWANETR